VLVINALYSDNNMTNVFIFLFLNKSAKLIDFLCVHVNDFIHFYNTPLESLGKGIVFTKV